MSNAHMKRLAGLALGALVAAAAQPVLAADLDDPYAGPGSGDVFREERVEEHLPPPPPPPAYGPRFTAGPGYAAPPPREGCRTTVTRRIDEDGDEFERRVSVCDEPPHHRPPLRPSIYGLGPGPMPPVDVPDGRW